MNYRTRIKYTSQQKAEMWARWQRGESLNAVDRFLLDNMLENLFQPKPKESVESSLEHDHMDLGTPLVGCVEGRVAPGAATERPRADNHGLASFLADTSPDRREMLVIQQSILFLIQAVTQFSFLVLNFLPHKPIR